MEELITDLQTMPGGSGSNISQLLETIRDIKAQLHNYRETYFQ